MQSFHLKNKSILIVDDESDLREIIASEFEFHGAIVYQAENILGAKVFLNQYAIDLIISDIRMPGGTGIELLEYTRSEISFNGGFILISGFSDIQPEDAFSIGADALLAKPFQLEELLEISNNLMLPFENRFSKNFVSTDYLPVDHSHTFLARGGFTTLVPRNLSITEGQKIHFNFDKNGIHLRGEGICRWIRKLSSDTSQCIIGIEFTYLGEDSKKSLKEVYGEKSTSSFLPHPRLYSLNQ